MEYTGKYWHTHTQAYGDVSVLEYKSNDNFPWCDCDICGKPICKRMFVVQDNETDIELLYLGSECIKKLK